MNLNRSPFALCSLLLAVFFALPFAAYAQTATATLSGTAVDQNGAVVPNVQITVENIEKALKREAMTNDEGYFTVPLLPPATYSLTAQRAGFMTARVDAVVLNVGDQKAFQIQLKTGNISETVNITNEAPLINESPAVGTVVDQQFAANIPLNGRSFQSLITLTPGVVTVPAGTANTAGQFSVNGQRASANSFTVDGVSANFGASAGNFGTAQSSGNLPALTTFGTTQSLVAVDALQEFKVQTSSYSAEYGRQPGGQISIVTRSGNNQFHGSLFDYLRNDVFDANDWFANASRQTKAAERQNDFGATFSGPVVLPRFGEGGKQPGYNGRNRTFFFFSYEGLRLRLPQFNLTNVPTLTVRQQAQPGIRPLLNAFPLPNGRDLGNGLAEFSAAYSNPSSLNATSIRIDHTLTNKVTLFGRYNRAPSETVIRQADLNLGGIQTGHITTQTATFGISAALSTKISDEARVNFSDNKAFSLQTLDSFGGSIPLARSALIPASFDSPIGTQMQFRLNLPGFTSVFFPTLTVTGDILTSQRQLNIVDNFSWNVGAHQLKFGVDYRRLMPTVASNTYAGIVTFANLTQVLNATAGSALIQANILRKPVFLNLSVYGQDTWRLSSRLTLDLGLRWDVNPAPSEANGNNQAAVNQVDNLATTQLAPLGTKAWKTTYNNLAPRLGFAYRLSQTAGRETVLRGGFGVYYDTGNDSGAANFNNRFPYASSRTVTNVSFPLSATQVSPAPLPITAGITTPYPIFFVFDPTLKLPYTLQWNLGIERGLGKNHVFTASYVGAAGRRLIQETQINLTKINPSFTTIFLTKNAATSDYQGLQAQFQRRLSRGLQALVSYTWSHALDDDSGSLTGRVAQRGNAAFDIRHLFAGAVTYDIPTSHNHPLGRAAFGGWSIDTIVHAQTALPVDLVAGTLVDPLTGLNINIRPNVISGVPFYLKDANVPGGRRINNIIPTAVQIAASGCAPLSSTAPAKGAFCTPPAGQSGNFGRNQVRGLGAWQFDVALRRQFKLTEKLGLQFRAEAFNIFNHPNFGTVQSSLAAANFGQATNMLNRQLGGISQLYQIGGPRSFQFALKILY